MPYDSNPTVDWSTGAVLLRNGSIFCSPNSKRPVLIPDEAQARINPFQAPFTSSVATDSLNFNFMQPVWWNWNFGWIAFVPMSPSFLSLPFQPLCWKPRVIETFKTITLPSGTTASQRRYTLHSDDCLQWRRCQQQIARAADTIRMFYHIPGTIPPLPSSLGLEGLHRSRNVAERCISACRKLFVVWMGFLSYLIAQTTRPEYQKPTSGLLPSWYNHLLEKGFAPPWLDGLLGSSVCAFDSQTVRSGVLFSFTDNDRHRPPAQWFIAQRVPCWYPFSRFSEEYMKRDAFLRKLIPPSEMLQEALTKLFVEPRLPLVLFIIKGYRDFEWEDCAEEIRKILNIKHSSSEVLRICSNELAKRSFRFELDLPAERNRILREMKTILAEREEMMRLEILEGQVCLEQGMVDRDDFEGMTTLHADWTQFFSKRTKRETELCFSESEKDRNSRLQREKNPPIKRSKMYVWQAVKTSGGRTLYARTLAKQREHEELVASYKPSETKFYARFSEWDFFEDFDPDSHKQISYDNFGENELEPDRPIPSVTPEDTRHLGSQEQFHMEIPIVTDDNTMGFYATAAVEDYPPQSLTNTVDTDMTDAHMESRIIERAHWQFGFVPPLGKKFAIQEPSFSWKEVLHTLGSLGANTEFIAATDKAALQIFFSTLIKKTMIPSDLDDLSDQNHSYLLSGADLGVVTRVGKWFIFHTLHSTTSTWFLGVNSAAAVLYILRIMATTQRRHTTYTLGNLLIGNGVRFRTFEKLARAEYHRLWQPFRPESYRKNGYKFTAKDFQASLLQTKYLLRTLPGRAALLEGGIIGRIAREFLRADSVLDGPSAEATFARNGLCVDARDGQNEYWDDDLTELERAIICGTYIMYTGAGEQTTKISWFPPPQSWEGSSYDSLEWTPKAEEVFQSVFVNARRGEFQPLSAKKWRDRLRDFKTPRKAFENNKSRADNFLQSKFTMPVI